MLRRSHYCIEGGASLGMSNEECYIEAKEMLEGRIETYSSVLRLLLDARELLTQDWPARTAVSNLLVHLGLKKRDLQKSLEYLESMGPALFVGPTEGCGPVSDATQEAIRAKLEEAKRRIADRRL